MRTKKHQFRFNLVEIILAMGVVALGMTAVLALLSPALNANRDSLGESVAAEAAANMVTYIDRISQVCAEGTSEFKITDPPMDPAGDDSIWTNALDDHFEMSVPGENSIPIYSESGDTLAEPFDRFKIQTGSQSKPGWMVYLEGEDGVPAANVYVWMKKIDKQPSDSADGIHQLGASANVRSCYRFYIKVCWPVKEIDDAPAPQERTFVYEIMRPVKH